MWFPAKLTQSCIRVAIPVDWVILHLHACGADGRSGGHTVTWISNFLGWVHYFIFVPMMSAARASRERAPLKISLNWTMILLSLSSWVQNTNQDLVLHQFEWERRPSTMCPLCVISVYCWIIKLFPMMIISANCASDLRNIGKIRKYLDEGSTETLIHAFVPSKLDHCNSLLYGLPKCLIIGFN